MQKCRAGEAVGETRSLSMAGTVSMRELVVREATGVLGELVR